MRGHQTGQDEHAHGIDNSVVRGLRPHRSVGFAYKSDPVSLDDEEAVRDRVAA
jgi:hypothetical protein